MFDFIKFFKKNELAKLIWPGEKLAVQWLYNLNRKEGDVSRKALSQSDYKAIIRALEELEKELRQARKKISAEIKTDPQASARETA
jgi:ribosome-associated translation inhibitor RaiA